jgi:LysM repeat protein
LKPEPLHLQGDTLSKIARKFETSIDVLSKLNGIRDADKIFAGKASPVHMVGCWK